MGFHQMTPAQRVRRDSIFTHTSSAAVAISQREEVHVGYEMLATPQRDITPEEGQTI